MRNQRNIAREQGGEGEVEQAQSWITRSHTATSDPSISDRQNSNRSWDITTGVSNRPDRQTRAWDTTTSDSNRPDRQTRAWDTTTGVSNRPNRQTRAWDTTAGVSNRPNRQTRAWDTTTSDSNRPDRQTRSGRISATSCCFMKCLCVCLLVAAMVSVPWEFIRLYQKSVAERASRIVQGAPPDCHPENLTLFERIRSLLVSWLSWTHATSPCQEYYYAVLVDPLWEVTPVMVLCSVFTKCCLHPLELASASLGQSMRLFFSEIPFQWQPFVLLIASTMIFVMLLMLFGYRLSIPLILRLEPKTPPCNQACLRNRRYQDNVARRTETNCNSIETQNSLLDKSVRTPFHLPLRTSHERFNYKNNLVKASSLDLDCRRVMGQGYLCTNNIVQCSADRNLVVLKKQSARDSWKVLESGVSSGRTKVNKHQALQKYQSKVAVRTLDVIETEKRTVSLKSRKRNVTKKKSELNSLWKPSSEDLVSSESE